MLLPPGTNIEGAVVFLGGMGLAIGAGKLAGVADEGPHTVAGGILVVALDLFLRLVPQRQTELEKDRGPRIVLIPAWALGIFWIGLGKFDTVSGNA